MASAHEPSLPLDATEPRPVAWPGERVAHNLAAVANGERRCGARPPQFGRLGGGESPRGGLRAPSKLGSHNADRATGAAPAMDRQPGRPGPPNRGPGSDLQSLVAHYNRVAPAQKLRGTNVELEVRFHEIGRGVFQTILAALAAGEAGPTDGGRIVQTVATLMPEDPLARRNRGRGPEGGGRQRASLVKEQTFGPGGMETAYRRKSGLFAPYRVALPHAPPYLVAVSAESAEPEFTPDRGATIRVKRRASFELQGAPWRVDLTVVRPLTGADAAALPGILQTMFALKGRPLPPAAQLLEGLDGDGGEAAQAAAAALYRYEVEIEHLAEPGQLPVTPAAVTAIAESILRLSDPRLLQEADRQAEVRRISDYLLRERQRPPRVGAAEGSLKRLLPAVTALSAVAYAPLYPPTGFFLLDKADGVRALASAHDGVLRFLPVGGAMEEFSAPEGGAAPARPPSGGTVVDGEYVGGVLYAFDVLVLRGENLTGRGYEDRVARLGDAVAALGGFGLALEAKPMVHLTASTPEALRAQFRDPALVGRPYATDGWILTRPGKPYLETDAYKWKPPAHTTIDLLARRPPPAAMGHPPFVDAPGCRLHFLFAGISRELFRALSLELVDGYSELFPSAAGRPYFPAQFSPSDAPRAFLYQHPDAPPAGDSGWVRDVDGQVLELRCAEGCRAAGGLGLPSWELVRVRADRASELQTGTYFGNDFRVAELSWLNYVAPFPEAQLWEGIPSGYFAPKGVLYDAQTAFVSFAKAHLLVERLSRAPWVVDLGVGRGADLPRYWDASVGHLIGVDADRAALAELVQRKYSLAVKEKKGAGRGRGAGPTVSVLRADLRTEAQRALGAIRSVPGFPPAGADAVVCNLALHYFADTAEHLEAFAALCRNLVRPGGQVLLSFLLGERVHALLAREKIAVGATWEAHQEGVLKYAIRRDFAEEALTPAGQQVAVLLPFSSGQLRSESLVNVEHLERLFAARGFSRECGVGLDFEDLLPRFREKNRMQANRLTGADLEWVALMGAVVFRRGEADGGGSAPDTP